MEKACSVRRAACLLAAIVAFSSAVRAAGITITVEAGKFDRRHSPIVVPITQKNLDLGNVVVAGAERKCLSQVTGPSLLAAPNAVNELHFILPSEDAGQSKLFKTTEVQLKPPASFRWEEHPGESMDLFDGARLVLTYICKPLDESSPEAREATLKPFHHVYDPSGKVLLTKGPGGLFTHHRGLFFGFMKVTYDGDKVCDVWHCRDGAYQRHEKVISSEAGPVLARQRSAISWHGRASELFANEERELTVYHVPDGTLIDFASRVAPLSGTMKVDGDPQHAGFQFRAAQEVAMQTQTGQDDAVNRRFIAKGKLQPNPQTYYLRPDGKGKLGETRNWDAKTPEINTVNLPWNAMSIVVGGQRYTVEYMDSPNNPKEARYSERDYGRFGSYFVAEATPAAPLEVRYRLWIQSGEMTIEQAAAKDADFDEPPKVTVTQFPDSSSNSTGNHAP
ncbi:MAG: PmoA family protein [Pirellulales bacterium]|nr:PmoA family protein [Pirellulales bacterium]